VITNEQQAVLLVEQFARMMGTDVSVHLSVAPSEQEKAEQATLRCLDWLREVDRTLTRFDPQRELCQLNAAVAR
jgi:hypothetical protein